jgi:hypothetical protein
VYTPDEGMLNALEALKSAALGQLDEPSRREALELFDQTKPTGPLAERIRALLDDAPALPPRDPSLPTRLASDARAWYLRITGHPVFPTTVDLLFISLAAITVFDVVALGLDGPGIVTFAERVTLFSSLVAAALIVVGAVLLVRSRPLAYRWFDRGLLVQLFVVQIFVFAEEQLAGTIGLVVTLAAWALLRTAMRAEDERAAMAYPAQ